MTYPVPATSTPALPGGGPPVLGGGASIVPQSMQLSRNPMLPQHPLGAYTDSQYEAQNAMLQNQIAKQYADLLQQLGYVDPTTGNFVQGSVEAQATRDKAEAQRSANLADEDVTKQHQLLGTLFSGLRGTDQARAEYPFVQQIANLDTQVPLTLGDLYGKAAGLMGDYTLQQNQLLADAASRQAANIMNSGGGGPVGGGVGGGVGNVNNWLATHPNPFGASPTAPPLPTDASGLTQVRKPGAQLGG
jgi:hypothetical protein